MKNTNPLVLAAVAAVLLLQSGCSSAPKRIEKLKANLEAFDSLGIQEVDLPGRYTDTEYRRVDQPDGTTVSELKHINPLLIKPARIKRIRPTPAR
jgi:hypothetical protein